MKKLFTLALIIFLSQPIYAQSQSEYSYSIGFKLYGYGEFPKLMNEIKGSEDYRSSSFNALVFKFNDNQMSYRIIGARYTNDKYSFKNLCKDCETVTGKYTDFTAKIGFERNVLYGIVQPYYGVDLGYRKIDFDGSGRDNNSGQGYNITVEKNGGIVYPFMGVKINILNSRLTLAGELGVDVLYSHDKETKTDNANNLINLSNFRRWGFYNQPLGQLSLQFNFGNQ